MNSLEEEFFSDEDYTSDEGEIDLKIESTIDQGMKEVVEPDDYAEDLMKLSIAADAATLMPFIQYPEWMSESNRVVKEKAKQEDEKQKKKLASTKQVLHVYVDSEFTSTKNLSLQVVLKGKIKDKEIYNRFILLDSSLQPYFSEDLLKEVKQSQKCDIFFTELNLGNTQPLLPPIESYLRQYNLFLKSDKITMYLWLYYSPTDLNIALGSNYMRKAYLGKKGNLKQRRSLSGKLTGIPSYSELTVIIRDLYGLDSKGLNNLANTYNLTSNIKKALDQYKSNMLEAVKVEPKLFLEYGIDDVVRTSLIPDKVVETFNNILNKTLGLKESKLEFNLLTIPLTIGSLVHNILVKLIRYGFFNNNEGLLFAISRLSVLNKATIQYDDNLVIFTRLRKIKTLSELDLYLSLLDETLKKAFLQPSSFVFTGYQYASAKWCLMHGHNNSLASIANTSGGRTVNERPREFYFEHGVDADIAGAYGSRLEMLGIPLGKPYVFTETPNIENTMTLGSFMKKYEDELNHPYWKLTVSGELPFNQDLIYSRIINQNQKEKAVANVNPEETSTLEVSKEIALLRREIIEGVITEPIWEVLMKVSTNKEKEHLKNLKVTNALYWKASEKCTLIEFSEKCLKDTGQYKFDKKTTSNVDTRGHYWCLLPLNETVKNLRDQRAGLKKKEDDVSKSQEQGIKLIINTMYGVICSVFFSLHNTVVGDIITSSVRTACWMMAKAFFSYISVTDGTPFSLTKVAFLEPEPAKKPGMNILSSYYSLVEHESIKSGPLGGEDWPTVFQKVDIEKLKTVASLAKKHIDNFWKRYDLLFSYDLEIKHYIEKAAYFSKAHYYFKAYKKSTNSFDDSVVKIRGFKPLDKGEVPYQNPMYDLLSFMLTNPEKGKDLFHIPNNFMYQSKKILKIESWKRSLIKDGSRTPEQSYFGPDILPGDAVLINQQFRLNNAHFPIYTLAQYNKISRRGFRRQQQTKEQKHIPTSEMPYLRLFERFLPTEGLYYMLNKMLVDSLKQKPSKKQKLDSFSDTTA